LAREIRLLVGSVLGNWAKVLQLTLLMIVFALLITVIAAAAGGSWPISLLNLGLREFGQLKAGTPQVAGVVRMFTRPVFDSGL
jgi:hypothetical protein